MNQPTVGFGNPVAEPTTKAKIQPKATFENQSATGVVLNNWKHAKAEYDQAKARLDECKGYVLQHIEELIDVGTTRISTGFFVLKTSKTAKYTVDNSDMQALNNSLTMIANLCGGDVAGSLLNWKPTLNVKVYEQLPPQAKAEIDKFVTMSYGSPTLAMEEL